MPLSSPAASGISARDSGGKNSYHYHDPGGGPWRFVPWDFNHSFGQDWMTLRVGTTEFREDYRVRNELFGRMLDEPTIGRALELPGHALLIRPGDAAAGLVLPGVSEGIRS